ncbi:MAG: hypothetical protein AAGD40_04240 [Pseudomonadota bacterium]
MNDIKIAMRRMSRIARSAAPVLSRRALRPLWFRPELRLARAAARILFGANDLDEEDRQHQVRREEGKIIDHIALIRLQLRERPPASGSLRGAILNPHGFPIGLQQWERDA